MGSVDAFELTDVQRLPFNSVLATVAVAVVAEAAVTHESCAHPSLGLVHVTTPCKNGSHSGSMRLTVGECMGSSRGARGQLIGNIPASSQL